VSSSVDLAALVRAEIAATGYSQAEVCRAVGITPKHLTGFLTGKTGMSLVLVDEVLAVLGRQLVLSTRAVEHAG
jgi:transcriptional regulator with XRE-family HTH domain